MKAVLQKVKKASVRVDKKIVGEIAGGFVVLLGVGKDDSEKDVDWVVEKILKLRLFGGSNRGESFMEKNIQEVNGSALVVSQFTLFGDCKKGTRPSFSDAAPPEQAEKLYDYFVEKLRESGLQVETGVFATYMEVELVNDGPITLIIDTSS